MENIVITDNILRNKKHLNNLGCRKPSANMRYNLLGKTPTFRPKKPVKSQYYYQQLNRNGYDQGDFYNVSLFIII